MEINNKIIILFLVLGIFSVGATAERYLIYPSQVNQTSGERFSDTVLPLNVSYFNGTAGVFIGRPTSNQLNIVGGGYTNISVGTIIFNQDGSFNASNDTFIAPVSGLYQVIISMALLQANDNQTYNVYFINKTTEAPYFYCGAGRSGVQGFIGAPTCSGLANMNAGSQGIFQIYTADTLNSVDIHTDSRFFIYPIRFL